MPLLGYIEYWSYCLKTEFNGYENYSANISEENGENKKSTPGAILY
jgi:hypothetical protein